MGMEQEDKMSGDWKKGSPFGGAQKPGPGEKGEGRKNGGKESQRWGPL